MWAVLASAAGALLVLVALSDIMATVLHPEVESRLSTTLQRQVWRGLRLLAGSRRRHGEGSLVLNWGLPLMVGGLIAVWLALFAAGFALIYLPWLGDPRRFGSDDAIDSSLLGALYYSGVTLATLGYGDVRPLDPVLRLLSVLQALCGTVTISAGVAYILSVYPALAQQRQVATALDAEVAGRADALPMLRRYLDRGEPWRAELLESVRALALELLSITGRHETHPVLYYAHPRRVQHSFLRVLVTAQALVAALRYGLAPDRHAALMRHPHLLLLEQSLHYTLRRLSDSLHIAAVPEPGDDGERQRLARAYAALCDEVERMGLCSSRESVGQAAPVLVDAPIEHMADEAAPSDSRAAPAQDAADPALDLSARSPAEAYVTFRLETDRYLAAYAAASGYDLDAARADYPASWWTG